VETENLCGILLILEFLLLFWTQILQSISSGKIFTQEIPSENSSLLLEKDRKY